MLEIEIFILIWIYIRDTSISISHNTPWKCTIFKREISKISQRQYRMRPDQIYQKLWISHFIQYLSLGIFKNQNNNQSPWIQTGFIVELWSWPEQLPAAISICTCIGSWVTQSIIMISSANLWLHNPYQSHPFLHTSILTTKIHKHGTLPVLICWC